MGFPSFGRLCSVCGSRRGRAFRAVARPLAFHTPGGRRRGWLRPVLEAKHLVLSGLLDEDRLMNAADAEIGLAHRRVGGKVAGDAVADDAASLDQIAAIGNAQALLGVLLDQQDADAALAHGGQRLEQFVGEQRRQAERGLVEQQELGRRHHGAADRHHLLLAAAHGARRLGEAFLQARKQLQHALEIAAERCGGRGGHRRRAPGSRARSGRRRCRAPPAPGRCRPRRSRAAAGQRVRGRRGSPSRREGAAPGRRRRAGACSCRRRWRRG